MRLIDQVLRLIEVMNLVPHIFIRRYIHIDYSLTLNFLEVLMCYFSFIWPYILSTLFVLTPFGELTLHAAGTGVSRSLQ